jgi:ribosomal protein S12 methylthiotransferase
MKRKILSESKIKVLMISLGCDKNLVDSEKMLGLLADSGYEFTDDEQEADAVVVNTCCFINDAKQESIDNLLQMAELRKQGKIKALVATGCLAERYREEIQKEIPEVDEILGTTAIDSLVSALDEIFAGRKANHYASLKALPLASGRRIVSTGGHFAYLKIAEGCDKHCTYCIIPRVRGDYRSVPEEQLVSEAEKLADGGVRELILVAQETTVYGTDLYGRKCLPELLHRLCRIKGLKWIRVLYCYPEEIDGELIDAIASEPKICHYLDLPIQHASNRILRSMGRRTSKEDLIRIISGIRARIPDICLRTTLITGFPGETEEEHRELMDFVKEQRFDRLGVFTYSREEDTPAASYPDQIHAQVKKKRQKQLMELQQKIAFEKASGMKGTELEAVVEGRITEDNIYVARTYRDAPGVDGLLFVNSGRELMTGDFIRVRVTGSDSYDLTGDEITEHE